MIIIIMLLFFYNIFSEVEQFKKLIRLLAQDEETPRVTSAHTDHHAKRKNEMEEIAAAAGHALGLLGLRFISRSSRLNGAYTYSAINQRHENVVLKIQPINEVEGYKKVQRLASRLPPGVAIHLPTIHRIRPLAAFLYGQKAAWLANLDGLVP